MPTNLSSKCTGLTSHPITWRLTWAVPRIDHSQRSAGGGAPAYTALRIASSWGIIGPSPSQTAGSCAGRRYYPECPSCTPLCPG
jgi:hypothetical protein